MADEPLGEPNRIDAPKDVSPYDLAPPETPVKPVKKPGKLSEQGLIDDMPEDADFENDPEVERALKGEPVDADSTDTADVIPPEAFFIKPGGDAKTLAAVGAGIALAAVIAAGVTTSATGVTGFLAAAALALYLTAMHTATGVVSLAVTAHLVKQPLGPMHLAAARMLIAVSVAMFLINLHMSSMSVRLLETLLAAGAYLFLIAVMFRLAAQKLMYVIATHISFMIAVWLAMVLYYIAQPLPAKP